MKASTVAVLAGVGIGAYLLFKPKGAEASTTGIVTDSNGSEPVSIPPTDVPSNQPAIAKRKGQLVVKLNIRVAGWEKLGVSKASILRDVLKGARALAATLPETCPHAPKLMIGPTGTITDNSNGFSITLAWDAVWRGSGTGPIKASVRDCIIQQIRKEPKINERFISLSATRTSAYA